MTLLEIEQMNLADRYQGTLSRENDLWAGYVALQGGEILNENLLSRAHVLRGNVYVDELAWLQNDQLDTQGQEHDSHDVDSDHVVLVDNGLFGTENPFVFANLRYIHRGEGKPLPVEEEFGVSLEGGKDAVEMSRFMSRHFDARIESLASVFLVSHTVGMLSRNGMDGYAVLELPLLRRLKGMGMVLEQLSEIKTLASYGNTRNCAVRIVSDASIERAADVAEKRENFPYGRLFAIARQGTMEELLNATYDELMVKKEELPV